MSAPSTPVSLSIPVVASDQPTGNWRHPRFDEISQRLEASTFNDKKVKQILWRLSALLAFLFYSTFNGLLKSLIHIDLIRIGQSILPHSLQLTIYPALPITILIYALLPLRLLVTKPDDLSDIPLTPQQRKLLGLRPSSQPATPGSQYITPPRYSRSGTPRSLSSSQSGSPYSNTGSPIGFNGGGASHSPSASPLFQKALGRDAGKRLSFGPPSPLALSRQVSDSGSSSMQSVPNSPLNNKGASVALNSKWLYERGRRSSSGLNRVFS